MVHPTRSTTGLPALLSCLMLSACATASLPPIPQPQPLQVADFVVYQGDSIVASERAEHFRDHIEGMIDVTGRARVVYSARFDQRNNLIDHIDMETLPWEGRPIARSQVAVDFVGDSIFVNRTVPLPSSRRVGGGRPVPYIHPSPVLLEQIVLRALRMGGNPAQVRVWFVGQNGATYASVSFVSGRVADVRILGSSFRVWMDDFGLLMAEVPQLGWLIQRRVR